MVWFGWCCLGGFMQVDCCVPDWFVSLLEEWGKEYGAGNVVDLSARSGTQIIWGAKNKKGFCTTELERYQVNAAFRELREYAEYAAGLIEFVYLAGRRRSMRDVELTYNLSNRAAGEEVLAAEALMYSGYIRLRNAA